MIKFLNFRFFLAILIIVVYFLYRNNQNFFEKEAPIIVIDQNVLDSLKIDFEDKETGLSEVIVRINQRRKKITFIKEKIKNKKHIINLDFKEIQENLKPGSYELEIKAFDRSFWVNSETLKLNLTVDSQLPRIEIVSRMHNGRRGGLQLAVYNVEERNLKSTGIRVKDQLFPSFRTDFIEDSIYKKKVYSFYKVPFDTEINSKDIQVYAEDFSGNINYKSFYNLLLNPKSNKRILSFSEKSFYDRLKILKKEDHKKSLDSGLLNLDSIIGLVLSDQKKIKEDYNFKFPIKFLNPSSYLRYGYNDLLEIFIDEQKINYNLTGLYFTHSLKPVLSSVKGKILFAGDIPVHGRGYIVEPFKNFIIIYAGFSDLNFKTGDMIKESEELGQVSKGQGISDGLYFEMRYLNNSINPMEWFDKEWVKQHIHWRYDVNQIKY